MTDKDYYPSLSQSIMVGCYRSGTEYATNLFANHPRLSSSGYNINVMMWAYGLYDPISEPANLRRAIADMAIRNRLRYNVIIDEEFVFAKCMEKQPVTYGVLYDVLMSSLMLTQTRRHWLEKVHHVWRRVPEFLNEVPNGRVIMVLRDPRSVMASFRKLTYVPPPAYFGAIFNVLDVMQHIEKYQETLPKERFLWFRYEDAALYPEETTQKVFDFLGLDPKEAGEEYRVNKWKKNTLFEEIGGEFNVQEAIYRWKKHLDAEELSLAEFVCGKYLEKFGYEVNGKAADFDWPSVLKRILPSEQIAGAFRNFILTGEGGQFWPADPHDPRNWPEARGVKLHKRHEDDDGGNHKDAWDQVRLSLSQKS